MRAKVIRLLGGRVAVVLSPGLVAHRRTVGPVPILPRGLRPRRVLLRPLRERALPLRGLLRRLSRRVRARSLRGVGGLLRSGRRLSELSTWSGTPRTAVSSLLLTAILPVPTSFPPTRWRLLVAVSNYLPWVPVRRRESISPAQTGRRVLGPRASCSAIAPTPRPRACVPPPSSVCPLGATTRGWPCHT